MDCVITSQSMIFTSTCLLGFLMLGEGVVSHLRTEDDRGAVDKNSNGHP